MTAGPETAGEALRILRKIDVKFADGSAKTGSGFVGSIAGTAFTCAHVVLEAGTHPKEIRVNGQQARILKVCPDIDLACLEVSDTEISTFSLSSQIALGDQVMFSGFPTGVLGPSLFTGILSAHGPNLLPSPKCRLMQINGMINLGNSGGPLFRVGSLEVIGVITAKFVPLLQEIDNLRDILRTIPQFPSEVGIGRIDFSKFVNLVMRALLSVSGSLRLVQVGIGYAVPIDLWT